MEQREQKLNLFGLCRNIVQTRAESSLLGCAECSRYSTKLIVTEEDEVKLAWAMPWRELTTSREERLSLTQTIPRREGRRRSQNEGEANGYGNQSFGVNVDTACCLNYHQIVIIKIVGTICYLSIINQEQNVPT